MPPLRVLARILLVLLLLADGVLGARAATLMAAQHATGGDDADTGHAAHRTDVERGSDCLKRTKAPATEEAHADPFEECGCLDGRSCTCNCLLLFYPDGIVLLFWSQRSSSAYLATASLGPPRLPMSRVFRPPIG